MKYLERYHCDILYKSFDNFELRDSHFILAFSLFTSLDVCALVLCYGPSCFLGLYNCYNSVSFRPILMFFSLLFSSDFSFLPRRVYNSSTIYTSTLEKLTAKKETMVKSKQTEPMN